MSALGIGEYRPDVNDTRAKYTSTLTNVLPRGDGYGPLKDVSSLTSALPSACRGYFVAQQTDGSGSVAVFAGTATDLYLLDNSTFQWTLVSLAGGPYVDLSSDAHWSFEQFNNVVLATHKNVNMQAYNLLTSSAFADNAGSPPRAGGVTVINRFVVLYDLLDNPNRVQWSGLNDITNYVVGTNYASYQDFPDGGRVLAVAGGEFGVILQAQAIRRIVLALGSDLVFQIERIARDRGMLGPYSLIEAGSKIMFATPAGFMELGGEGEITPIGLERVDRTFLATYDSASAHMIIGAADPARNLAIWVYKSLTGVYGQFDKGLVYNWALQRWAPFNLTGEYIAQASQPGVTLEFLDTLTTGALAITNVSNNGSGLFRITVASTATLTTGDYKTITAVGGATGANGSWTITVINATQFDLDGSTFAGVYTSGGNVSGSVDGMTTSFDDYGSATQPQISAFTTLHKLGFFSGSNLEAVLETSEQRIEGSRMNVNGAWPLTDAGDVYISAGTRDTLNGSFAYGTESAITADGHCPLLEEGRGVRFRVRIPAGTTWSYCSGVEGDIEKGSRY